jgi:ferredoxin-type protein NapF
MNCVDAKNKTLNQDRCVLCLNCAGSCAVGALDYGWTLGSSARANSGEPSQEDTERRTFLQKSVIFLAYLLGIAYPAGATLRGLRRRFFGNVRPAGRGPAEDRERRPASSNAFIDRIVPPGAPSAGHFSARCIGCLACASACPVGIIRTDDGSHPHLDYSRGYCQYSCTECMHACPTHALLPLGRDKKRQTRIALSNLTRANCVVITKQQSCGACAEVCPTHALRMESLGDGSLLTAPVFDAEYCIGCGGCLYVCPAEPKAFVVRGVSPRASTPGMRPAEPSDEPAPSLPSHSSKDFPF